jgi:hypothetical protein
MDPEIGDDSATTEATIMMVADLEEQLHVAKELSVGQTELIAQLEQQIEVLDEGNRIATEQYVQVVEKLKEADETVVALRQRLGLNVDAMMGGVVEILRLSNENAELKAALSETVEKNKELEKRVVDVEIGEGYVNVNPNGVYVNYILR